MEIDTIRGTSSTTGNLQSKRIKMKLVPGPLPPIPTNTTMDRLPLPLPFSPDLLWRYPLGFPSMSPQQPPSSPLFDYKSQLPSSLASDPRVWSREDVSTFLRWAETEFDLQPIDMDTFQMNGKAMCLLTRADLAERAPGSFDVLHNVLQILVRSANNIQRMLPSSPVTPTSRHPYPLSPHSQPPTPNWNILTQNSESFHNSHAASLAAHLMAQSNSVTLSPAPSVDSQAGSPQHADNAQVFGHSIFSTSGGSNGSGSNPSDSDEDGFDKNGHSTSPPNTPRAYSLVPQMPHLPPRSPKEAASSPGVFKQEPGAFKQEPGAFKLEFFPNDSPEPNTNGRLLWDFLQQLLNDPAQRYTTYIAWKNRDTGVFKIVDPAGLAKLWGIQKNHLSMNYDKMSRALRYYYRVNILRKVQGERHCYQFLRNPTELKNIKNISLLRQQMSPTSTKPQVSIPHVSMKPEPAETEQHEPVNRTMEFLRNPAEMKNIKSIPMHRQQMSPTNTKPQDPIPHVTMKPEPVETEQHEPVNTTMDYDEKPTDLSMDGPTDLSSSSSRYVNIICSPDPPITGTHH